MLTKKVTNKRYVLVGIYILRVLIKRDVRENSPRFLGLEYKDHTAMSAWNCDSICYTCENALTAENG
jgi:hypothetical protein